MPVFLFPDMNTYLKNVRKREGKKNKGEEQKERKIGGKVTMVVGVRGTTQNSQSRTFDGATDATLVNTQ